MAYTLPGANNTYVPSFDTTGNLIVSFSRNPKSFKLNQYMSLTPVKKSLGLFMRTNPLTSVRVQGIGGDADTWSDGNDAPEGPSLDQEHEFVPYTTERFTRVARLGYKAVEQAAFDIKQINTAGLGTNCMTRRTLRAVTALLDTTQYATNHVATATALAGGFWSTGTVINPVIQKALMAAARQIELDTTGVVTYTDLALVISPTVADAIARSAEMRDFIAKSPFVLDQILGDKKGVNAQYGLPDQIYGVKLIVENAVDVTTNRNNASPNAAYIMDSNTAVLLCRPGENLVKNSSNGSFSTLHCFSYEEMNAEYFDDVQNRVHKMRVTDDYTMQIVSPLTGYVVTNLLS